MCSHLLTARTGRQLAVVPSRTAAHTVDLHRKMRLANWNVMTLSDTGYHAALVRYLIFLLSVLLKQGFLATYSSHLSRPSVRPSARPPVRPSVILTSVVSTCSSHLLPNNTPLYSTTHTSNELLTQ